MALTPGKKLHFLTSCRENPHLSYFLILITRIYVYSIKKVAELFSAHDGQYLAENVAVDFPDGYKRGRHESKEL